MSQSESVLIHFIESCFRTFQEKGVTYCIMRNAEEVERGDAHDVDLAIDIRHLGKAEECLFRTAEDEGWELLFRTGAAKDKHNIKCYNFYKLQDGVPVLAHLDFFTSFMWGAYTMLDNSCLVSDIDTSSLYRRISPVVEVVDNLFRRLIYNGAVKRKYTPYISEVFRARPNEVKTCMEHFLSPALSESILALACAENWEAIDALRPQIIADVRRHAPCHRMAYWSYLIRKAIKPIGIVAVLQGTDGSGKTTIIDSLPQVLSNTWPADGAIRYFHCRPYVLEPSKQEQFGIHRPAPPTPHTGKPYGRLKSFAKLAYCVFDYIIGWWGPIHMERAKGHMVVFDRYYYDFYLDKLRYRFHLSDGVLRLMQHFIPKPDITFVLTGEAEPIWARKKELSLEEVQQQITRLEGHSHLFAHPCTINVVQPVKQVVNDVCIALLETQHQRFKRFLPRNR